MTAVSESRRATRTGDTVGHIEVVFSNATSSRPSRIYRTRPDVDSARRLVAHYQPYNNTRIDAATIVRVEAGHTYLTPVDVRVNGGYRYCPCGGAEADCTRPAA